MNRKKSTWLIIISIVGILLLISALSPHENTTNTPTSTYNISYKTQTPNVVITSTRKPIAITPIPIPTFTLPPLSTEQPVLSPIYTVAPISDYKTVTVYITKTGEKYHKYGCQYLKKSCIPIDLEDAKDEGYTPCSKCHPPR